MKYAVHPGWVYSRADGDRHFIGAMQLVRLYELSEGEYVIWRDGMDMADYIHLYPNYNGDYGRPKNA